MADSIESVSKVSETQSKPQSTETGEDHFQNVMEHSGSSSIQTSFERVDVSNMGIQHLEHKNPEDNKVQVHENVTSQQLGSATDQENKRQHSGSGKEDDVEEISGIEGTSGKGQTAEATERKEFSSTDSPRIVDDIKNQTQEVKTQIQEAKTQLSQTNGEIKSSYQKLLRNHLTHADDNLKIASSKMGLEYNPKVPAAQASSGVTNPTVKRFIEMLTNSEAQVDRINQELVSAASMESINPAHLLAIQQKMNTAHQEIELFVSLLNKFLESTKTLMNVQV